MRPKVGNKTQTIKENGSVIFEKRFSTVDWAKTAIS